MTLLQEETLFLEIYETLLIEGDLPEHLIEDKVHQILDNPELFPSYFS